MSLLSTHKKIAQREQKEFNEKLKGINEDFVRFQIEHNCRARIVNIYQENDQYAPNVLVDFICEGSQLGWRPLTTAEKTELNEKLLKAQGIILPDKGVIK